MLKLQYDDIFMKLATIAGKSEGQCYDRMKQVCFMSTPNRKESEVNDSGRMFVQRNVTHNAKLIESNAMYKARVEI